MGFAKIAYTVMGWVVLSVLAALIVSQVVSFLMAVRRYQKEAAASTGDAPAQAVVEAPTRVSENFREPENFPETSASEDALLDQFCYRESET